MDDELLTREEIQDIWFRLDSQGKMKCGQCQMEIAKTQAEKCNKIFKEVRYRETELLWEKVRTILVNYSTGVYLTEPVQYYINGLSVDGLINQMKSVETKPLSPLEKKKALMKLPVEERRKILKEQAVQFAKENPEYGKEV